MVVGTPGEGVYVSLELIDIRQGKSDRASFSPTRHNSTFVVKEFCPSLIPITVEVAVGVETTA